MHVVIAGGSGFVGARLCSLLRLHRQKVTILTHTDVQVAKQRIKEHSVLEVDPNLEILTYDEYQGQGDVLVNLAGESFGSKPIILRRLRALRNSRIETLNKLASKEKLPKIFMQASATAIYKNKPEVQNETSVADEDNELANLAREVEEYAAKLHEKFNFDRHYILRFGIVLNRNGGFMKKALQVPPFTVIHGDNTIPFIELDDASQAILFLAEHDVPSGIVNLTSPHTATLNDILKCCYKGSKLPPIPIMTGLLRLGDKRMLILKANQVISPHVLLSNNFKFLKGRIQNIE